MILITSLKEKFVHTEQTKQLASVQMVVDKMHMKGHTDMVPGKLNHYARYHFIDIEMFWSTEFYFHVTG